MMSLVSCGHFPVLFVAGGVEDKVEAVLQPEEEGDDEADVGDVVVVVAADELEGDDGQVADEVAHADGADGLGHALVARRQLAPHVVAEQEYIVYPRLQSRIDLKMTQCSHYPNLESIKELEDERTILHRAK